MRWLYTAAMLLFLLAILSRPAGAVSYEDAIRRQENALEVDELEDAANRAGSKIEYGISLDEGLNQLLEQGTEEAGGIFRAAMKSSALMMAVVLLCGVGESVYGSTGKGKLPVIPAVGVLAVVAIAAADVDSMLGLGRSAIANMTSFANVLLPTVAALTAATGAVTGAAVRQLAAVLFSDLLANLISSLLIPLLYGYLAASAGYAALGNEGLNKIGALLKWMATTLLTTVMLAFVGYLTLSGVIAGSADAMTVKAAKFAISGAIPVVGKILSDAAETVLASAGVLRGTVGVFGTVTILGICLMPILRIAAHYLLYKLVAALSAAVAPGRVSGLIERIGGAFGLLLGMTGACCLLLLVVLVSSVSAVSV